MQTNEINCLSLLCLDLLAAEESVQWPARTQTKVLKCYIVVRWIDLPFGKRKLVFLEPVSSSRHL